LSYSVDELIQASCGVYSSKRNTKREEEEEEEEV
jgi:hypothetical protein